MQKLIAPAVASLLLAGCGAAPDNATADPTGSPVDSAVEESPDLLVVSTVAPVADIVAQVLGDRGRVESLIPEGMDSHTYEPRPGDVAPLLEADLFIGNGLGLNQAAVDLAEANLPDGVPLVLLGEEALTDDDLSHEHWHDHGDEGSHSHGDEDGHSHGDGAPEGGFNPHVWTSVPNMVAYVEVVAQVLTAVDPEGADHYAQRAEEYRVELEALDDAIRAAVGSLAEERRKLVVYHDAWAYFGHEYGVQVIAAVQPSDYSEPSAADVRAIIDQIRAEDVPAIFGAEEFPNDVVAAIADETGAEYVGELADDTLPGSPGDPQHSYVGMMAENVSRVVDALGGDPTPLRALTGR